MDVKDLSPAHCVLLAVHLASESNIKALHSFTPSRLDALDPETVIRILLTYLPESLHPREYTNYVSEVASRLYLNVDREEIAIDTTPVSALSNVQAQKRVAQLNLLELQPPRFPPHAPQDILTRFLCHRAYRIDRETGLLELIPSLIEPFLDRNEYIRTWYIAVAVPILRIATEYYPDDTSATISLSDFEKLDGAGGVEVLLRPALKADSGPNADEELRRPDIARDIRGLVGPWMYGHTERQRRTEGNVAQVNNSDEGRSQQGEDMAELSLAVRKIDINGVYKVEKAGHDWEHLYRWMVHYAVDHFGVVARTVEEWDGPSDVDLGGFERGSVAYLDEEVQRKLERQYAQAAFASCYAAQADNHQTVREAHGVLARLAELLDFIPPPDLATSVDSLPRIERHAAKIEESQTTADLLPDALLRAEHPFTMPRYETYMLLQMMVYSAYQFSGLEFPCSLVNVARLQFYATAQEQIDVLRRILRGLIKGTARRDENQMAADRAKLVWLWSWGIESDVDNADYGAGVLGKIKRQDLDEEILKAFSDATYYSLAIQTYCSGNASSDLAPLRAATVVLDKAMEAYDSASNGSKTRGGVKKANDIIRAFQPHFPDDHRFAQASALIAATHAMSFYSLTLQHGVPFQPVSIRVSHDPVSLISRILEQTPKSYTQLDDLIGIARNFSLAGLPVKEDAPPDDVSHTDGNAVKPDALITEQRSMTAERRVTFMAVEAALREDDFETAYSYIVNKLTPSGPDTASVANTPPKSVAGHAEKVSRSSLSSTDEHSWRAAFLAGRYRPPTTSASPQQHLRRLEQRTELLSLALLLAPQTHLTEILAVWRRCEEETLALQRSLQHAEEDFDDRADKRLSGGSSALPGNFTVLDAQPDLILHQPRREVGRIAKGPSSISRARTAARDDDAPLSMLDLTRNAARAFSKNAFPLGDASAAAASPDPQSIAGDAVRVRRRDVVANAVSGGLASGLGWVLGATPVHQQQHALDERQ